MADSKRRKIGRPPEPDDDLLSEALRLLRGDADINNPHAAAASIAQRFPEGERRAVTKRLYRKLRAILKKLEAAEKSPPRVRISLGSPAPSPPPISAMEAVRNLPYYSMREAIDELSGEKTRRELLESWETQSLAAIIKKLHDF